MYLNILPFTNSHKVKQEKHLHQQGYANFKGLKMLTKDTIQFGKAKSTEIPDLFINEAEIHHKARTFSKQINDLYQQKGHLTPNDLQQIVKKHLEGKGEVMIQQMSQQEMNAAAYCATGIDKKGNPVTALFVDFTGFTPDLIENLVHEFTHVLQIFTEKQQNLTSKSLARGQQKHFALEEAANAFEDKILHVVNDILPSYETEKQQNLTSKSLARGQQKHFALEEAANAFEDKILHVVNDILPSYEDDINRRLNDPAIAIENIVDQYKLVSTEFFEKGLEDITKQYQLKNDDFALQYFLNKAQKEAQAHREGHISLKESHGFPDVRLTFDVIPVLYDRWASFLQTKLDHKQK
jgi:hypothetical protein